MDPTIRAKLDAVRSDQVAAQNEAYAWLMRATEAPVDWAYDAWDELVEMLRHRGNRVRAIASQVLCRLAASDPDARILGALDALLEVTRDERFVTARHCMQSLWHVGAAGERQRAAVVDGLSRRFAECATEKNCTLIRYDIIESLRKMYDAAPDETLRTVADALIATEPDPKYRKKYAGVWKGAGAAPPRPALARTLAAVLFALLLAACAGGARQASVPGAAGDAGALEVQRAWWRAYAVADTAYLQAHTAPRFSLTVSSGVTYDRAGMLAQAATHVNGGRLTMEWADETVRLTAPSVAIATTRSTEADGPASSVYRYLTVMERAGDGWRVVAAQSTRELAFTPRIPVAHAAELSDYAGAYRTPRGAALRVEVRDSALALIEPSGTEIRLEPIGPALFEFRALSPSNGIVRLVFTRDGAGRVAAMTRLVNGAVNTFPRMP